MYVKWLNLFNLLVMSIIISSCSKDGLDDPSTEVQDSERIDNVLIGYKGISANLGEFLVNDPTQTIPILVQNDGEFEIRNIKIEFAEESLYFTYMPTTAGAKVFPGVGGSCQGTLSPGESCTINLAFHPKKSGEFIFPYEVTYMSAAEKTVRRPMTVTARAGFPALLFISQGVSYKDWGVLEQTEVKNYISSYTVTNSGELSAVDPTINLTISGGNEAFELINNTCNEDIAPEASCTFSIKHTPLNNDPTDPSVSYSAVGAMSYQKDNKGQTGGISFQIASYSTLIQGIFEAAGSNTITFTPDIINGNKEQQIFKISNNGYRSGIPIEFIVKHADNSVWATCKKFGTAGEIKCYDAGNIELPLSQFPFNFHDLDKSLEKEIAGKTINSQGGSGFFTIDFQPSVANTAATNYTGKIIALKYDTLWKGETDIVTEDLFTIDANSIQPAKLELLNLSLNGNNLSETTITNPQEFVYNFYLGRLAKVTSPNYPNTISFQVINNGEAQATLTHYKDGDGFTITNTGQDINSYYRNILRSSCDVIMPGQTCTLTMDLTTLADPGGSAVELDLLNDTEVASPAACSDYLNNPQALLDNCHKQFFITYDDSSIYYDNGDPMDDKVLELRMSADLVAKAFLVYDDITSGQQGSINADDSKTYYLKILNIGTGPATYLRFRPGFNLKWNSNTDTGWVYGFDVVDQMHDNTGNTEIGTTGADYDCFALFDWNNTNYYIPGPGVYNSAKSLPAYENCVLKIDFSMHNTHRFTYYGPAQNALPASEFTAERYRLFQRELNNTMDMWEWDDEHTWARVRFEYADGDINATSPDSNIFGNYFILDEMDIQIRFNNFGTVVPLEVSPTYAGFINREEINLPMLDIPDYIWMASSGGQNPWDDFDDPVTIPDSTFYNVGTSSDPVKSYSQSASTLAANLDSTLPYSSIFNSDHDYHMQLGTIPANLPYDIDLSIKLNGIRGGADLTAFNYDSGSANMTFSSGITLPNYIAGDDRPRFTFTIPSGTPAGIEHGSVDYTFESRGETETVDIQVMAEVVDPATIPKVQLSFGDHQVNYDPITEITSVDPFVDPTDYHLNNEDISYVLYDDATSHTETMTAVKDSAVFAIKRIKVSNNSGFTVKGMRIFIYNTEIVVGNATAMPANLSINSNTCTNETFNNTDECYFDLKYEPTSGSVNQTYDIKVYHQIKNDQYSLQVGRIYLEPVSPASVYVVDTASYPSNIFDNNNPDIGGQPYPTTAHIFDCGGYNPVADSHIILGPYPTKCVSDPIELANSSTISASFLKGIDDPTTITFDVDGYTLIYDRISTGKTIQVHATEPCLVGDDVSINYAVDPIPDDAGFNVNTNPAFDCFIRIEYHAYGDEIGVDLDSTNLMATLFYWNNNRSSYDTNLNFVIRGFVEGPRSVAGNGGKMISMEMENGQISIDWPTFTTTGATEWGSITGYRVYWNNDTNGLKYSNQDIFLDDHLETITINEGRMEYSNSIYTQTRNFTINRFFSLMVVPIRTIQGTSDTYISASDLEVPILLSPSNNQFYDYNSFTLFETSIVDDQFAQTITEASSKCTSSPYQALINGSNQSFPRSLITLNDWEFILANSADVNKKRTPDDIYPDEFDAWPHWTSEATDDANNIFDPLGWDGSNLEYLDTITNTKLILDADNPGGRDINLIAGGIFSTPDQDTWVHPNYNLGLSRCSSYVNPYHPFTEPQP
ncbi:hypothetical protein N9N67_05005 [Bacteriovoracaceae bacterium]|nr:hypothetical protein [Bacteriovoracaceae bacterium]